MLLGFVLQKVLNILFLSETLCNANRMERIRVRLKYENRFMVNAIGRSGGLDLLWNRRVNVEVVGYSNHYIDTMVLPNENALKWRFTRYYDSLERHQRRTFWDLLRYLSSLNALPWILMGEFNDIMWEREKVGRVPHLEWLRKGFCEAVRECDLTNFDFKGCQFTWEGGRGTENWVQEKLDRILVFGFWSLT